MTLSNVRQRGLRSAPLQIDPCPPRPLAAADARRHQPRAAVLGLIFLGLACGKLKQIPETGLRPADAVPAERGGTVRAIRPRRDVASRPMQRLAREVPFMIFIKLI